MLKLIETPEIIETGNFDADAIISVAAGRSEEFFEKSQILSAYINELPLDHKQNNELIAIIISQIGIGEKDAFKYGLSMGIDIGKSFGHCI